MPGPKLRILYEDEWLVAVDKPAGIIVHSDGTGTQTLTDLLRAALAEQGASSDELQPLQRLDRDTTGIVLFSRRKDAQAAFDRLISERQIQKRYLAIASGRMPMRDMDLCGPIGRDRHDSRRMRVSRTGKPAHTTVHPLVYSPADAAGPARTLAAIDLHTGRKHQIRVHLSSAGFPLLGDALYGGPHAKDGLMLHACEERFTHPITGAHVTIKAPYPSRFIPFFSEAANSTRPRRP